MTFMTPILTFVEIFLGEMCTVSVLAVLEHYVYGMNIPRN